MKDVDIREFRSKPRLICAAANQSPWDGWARSLVRAFLGAGTTSAAGATRMRFGETVTAILEETAVTAEPYQFVPSTPVLPDHLGAFHSFAG